MDERSAAQSTPGAHVGIVIMLGILFGIIALVYGLVLRFDPEARRRPAGALDEVSDQ